MSNSNQQRRNFIKGLAALAATTYAAMVTGCSSLFKKDGKRAVASLADGTSLPVTDWIDRCYSSFKGMASDFSITSFRKFSSDEQKKNATDLNDFVSWAKKQMLIQPRDEKKKIAWRTEIQRRGRATFGKFIDLTDSEMDVMTNTGVLAMGGDFLDQVRTVVPGFSSKKTFQAGRNVGTVGLIQVTGGMSEARHNDAVFGYSMLYPYTDNYLDRTDISKNHKRLFADRFRKRLAGENPPADHPLEKAMFEMVEWVEKAYPRQNFPEVYASMIGIHDMQIQSLQQHSNPDPNFDYLRMSVMKGGASVLADAYMAFGKPSAELCEFSFHLGFALQLVDDLQDISQDQKQKQNTIFTQALARDGNLDGITNKLLNYWHEVVGMAQTLPGFKNQSGSLMTSLLQKGGTFIILEALAENPKYFSEGYVAKMQTIMPIGFPDANGLHIERKFVMEYDQFPNETIMMLRSLGRKA